MESSIGKIFLGQKKTRLINSWEFFISKTSSQSDCVCAIFFRWNERRKKINKKMNLHTDTITVYNGKNNIIFHIDKARTYVKARRLHWNNTLCDLVYVCLCEYDESTNTPKSYNGVFFVVCLYASVRVWLRRNKCTHSARFTTWNESTSIIESGHNFFFTRTHSFRIHMYTLKYVPLVPRAYVSSAWVYVCVSMYICAECSLVLCSSCNITYNQYIMYQNFSVFFFLLLLLV